MSQPQKEPRNRERRDWHSFCQLETQMAVQRLGWWGRQIHPNHPLCRLPAAAVGLVYQVRLLVGRSSEGWVEQDGGKGMGVGLSGRHFQSGAFVRRDSKIHASLICYPLIGCYLRVSREPRHRILRHRSLQLVIARVRRFHRNSFERVCEEHGGFGPPVGWRRWQRWRRYSRLQRRGFGSGLCLQTSFYRMTWIGLGGRAWLVERVSGSSNIGPVC